MTHVNDYVNTGFFPLQDWSWDGNDIGIGARKSMAACRIESQPDIESGRGHLEIGSDAQMGTIGDVHPWLFMQTRDRAERDMGSWMTMSVGMVMDGDTHYARAEVQPFYDDNYYNDIGYALQQPKWAQGTPYPVKGQWRMLFPGTQEEEQHVLSAPIDGRLVAPSTSGPAQAGTLVVDLQPVGEMCLDGEEQPGTYGRAARLQSLVRVLAVEPSSGLANKGGYNVLALNWGRSPLDNTPNLGSVFMAVDGGAISGPTTGGGTPGPITGPHGSALAPPSQPVIDNPGSGVGGAQGDFGAGGEEELRPHEFGEFQPKQLQSMAVAFMAKAGGGDGPITPGSSSDKHRHGTDRDGHPCNSAHISSQAFFYYNQDKDAPLEFSPDPYPRGGGLPLTARVSLSYDEQSKHPFNGGLLEGLWRWWCESPIVNPVDPPPVEDPPTGEGPPITGGGGGRPGGGGGPNPGGPGPGGPGTPGPIKPGGNRPGGPTTGGQPGGGNTGPGGPGFGGFPLPPGGGATGGHAGPVKPGSPPKPSGPITGKRTPGAGLPPEQDPDPGSGEPNGGGSTGGGSGGSTNDPCRETVAHQQAGQTGDDRDQVFSHASIGEFNPLLQAGGPMPVAQRLHWMGEPQTSQHSYAGPGGSGTYAHDIRVDIGRLEGRNPHTNEIETVPGIVPTMGSAGRDQVGLYALFHPLAEGFAAMQWRPHCWVGGAPNIEHNPQIPGQTLMEEERVRPQVLTMRAFGGMGDIDYDYVERPMVSRARGGTAHGGILLSPPRFEMEDYLDIGTGASRNVDEVTGDEATNSLFMLAPGVSLAFGKPNRGGTIQANGVTIAQDATVSYAPLVAKHNSTEVLRAYDDGTDVIVDLAAGGSGAFSMPNGTTAQRPATPVRGMMRLNTSGANDLVEFYDSTSGWTSLGAGGGSGATLAQGTIAGRGAASGSGVYEQITLGTNLSMSGTTLNASSTGVADADYGDITVTDTGATWTVDDEAITYAKMQHVSAANKVLGRQTAGAGDVEEVTCTNTGFAFLAASIARDEVIYGTNTDTLGSFTSTSGGRALVGIGSTAANKIAYFTGASSVTVADFTSTGRDLVAASDAADVQAVSKPIYRVDFHSDCYRDLPLTNHPSSDQFLYNSSRCLRRADLANYSQVRLIIRVNGSPSSSANTPEIVLRYSTSHSGSTGSYSTIGTSAVSASLASWNWNDSGWIDLVSGAKADSIYLAAIQTGGDGVEDPQVASVCAEFR